MKRLYSALAIGLVMVGLLGAILVSPQVEAAPPTQGVLLQTRGKVTLLRVHPVGTRYGPPTDQIDVEVVIQLDTQPGKAFGFQLRNDANSLVHQGQLDLLRDALTHNRTVTIDYSIVPGKNNGVILRAWLTR